MCEMRRVFFIDIYYWVGMWFGVSGCCVVFVGVSEFQIWVIDVVMDKQFCVLMGYRIIVWNMVVYVGCCQIYDIRVLVCIW